MDWPVLTGRCSALTMPEVTVELSPSGDPMATTPSPIRSREVLPSEAGSSSLTSGTSRTARS